MGRKVYFIPFTDRMLVGHYIQERKGIDVDIMVDRIVAGYRIVDHQSYLAGTCKGEYMLRVLQGGRCAIIKVPVPAGYCTGGCICKLYRGTVCLAYRVYIACKV